MNWFNRSILIIALVFMPSVFAATGSDALQKGVAWGTYSDTVFLTAQKQNKPVLILVEAEWCQACHQLVDTINNSVSLSEYIKSHFVVVKLDIDQQQDMAIKYKVIATPTIVVTDKLGAVLATSVGAISADKVLLFLTSIGHPSQGTLSLPIANDKLKSVIEDLAAKQNDIYHNDKNIPWDIDKGGHHYVDNVGIEYAMTMASRGDVAAEEWVNSVFNSEYEYLTSNSNQYLSKLPTLNLAGDIRLFAIAYSYWHDPKYLYLVDSILLYLDRYRMTSAGLYYESSSDKQCHPFVNGMLSSALTYAYRATGNAGYLNKATQLYQTIYANYRLSDGGYQHDKENSNEVYLRDVVAMGLASFFLYEETTNSTYMNQAKLSGNYINDNFLSKNNLGFVSYINVSDVTKSSEEKDALENVLVMRFMNVLYRYTGDNQYRQASIDALNYVMTPEIVAKHSPGFTLMSYIRVNQEPLKITIVGSKSDYTANSLFHTALSFPEIYSEVRWWDRNQGRLENQEIDYPVMSKSAAYICVSSRCSPPIFNPLDLSAFIHQLEIANHEVHHVVHVEAMSAHETILPDTSSMYNLSKILLGKNLLFTILGFWLLGVVLAFTPCFLPMTIIIAGLLGGGVNGVSKNRIILLSVLYVVTLAVTYAVSGLIVLKLGVYIEAYFQSAWVLLAFSLIFLLLGFQALGIVQLQLPIKLRHYLIKHNNFSASNTIIGVVIMGAMATLIASPCLAAPLIAILSYIAYTGNVVLGVSLLFVTGLGLGVPLILATIVGVNYLPERGAWQQSINLFFGIVLLGIAIWLIGHIAPPQFTMISWAALIIYIALTMGVFTSPLLSSQDKLWKTLSILVLVYGFIVFGSSFTVLPVPSLPLPSYQKMTLSTFDSFHEVGNVTELDKAFVKSYQDNKPIVLFFYSDWCPTCKAIESDLFANSKASQLLSAFTLLKVNIGSPGSSAYSIANKFSIVAPPAILFFDPKGNLLNMNIYENVKPDYFVNVLLAIKNMSIPPQ